MAPQLSEALKLSLPERILWVEALWNSIAADSKAADAIQLSEEQLKHLDKIDAEFEANPSVGSSWEKVKRNILSSSK